MQISTPTPPEGAVKPTRVREVTAKNLLEIPGNLKLTSTTRRSGSAERLRLEVGKPAVARTGSSGVRVGTD